MRGNSRRSLALPVGTGVSIFLLLAVSLRAHTIPVSYLTIVAGERYAHVELLLNSAELAVTAEVDANRNGRLDGPEPDEHGQVMAATVFERVALEVEGVRVQPETLGVASATDHHLTLRAQYPADIRQQPVVVRCNLTGITHAGHFTVIEYVNGSDRRSMSLEGGVSEIELSPSEPRTLGDLGRHVATRALTWQHVFLVLSIVGLANVLWRQVIVAATFIGGQVIAAPLSLSTSVAVSRGWLPWMLVVIGLIVLGGLLRGRRHRGIGSLLLPVVTAGVCSGVFLVSGSQVNGESFRELLGYVGLLSIVEVGLVGVGGLLMHRATSAR